MEQINNFFATTTGLTTNGQIVTMLYRTHFSDNMPCSEPIPIKEWYFNPDTNDSPVTDADILKEIELNDWSRWNTELVKDKVVEVSENIYWQMLECLPPKNWNGDYFEVGEPHHHDNNGRAIHRAFWIENDKFYTGYPKTNFRYKNTKIVL